MKYNKNSRWNVSEVAKKLGISFDELKAEFVECGIKVRADDSFDAETIQYVLSGMYGDEFDRGNHLHLETGDVAWEIQRGAMRWNEGDEHGMVHELTVSGWAQKLWLDENVLLNEMRSQGHSIELDDTVSPEVVRYAIDKAEVFGSWELLSVSPEGETYTPHREYHISEMALKLWVPATAMMSWLAYNGYKTDYMTGESKKAFDIAHKNWDIDRGTSHNAWVVWEECETWCEHTLSSQKNVKKAIHKNTKENTKENTVKSNVTCSTKTSEVGAHCDIKHWIVASADPVEVEGIVASSESVYAGSTGPEMAYAWWAEGGAVYAWWANYTKTIARGLLWFLAVPLLFGLFGRSGWDVATEVVTTGPSEISLHGVDTWVDKENVVAKKVVVMEEEVIVDAEVVAAEVVEAVEVKQVVKAEEVDVSDILDDQVAAEPMQVKDFINHLVGDIDAWLGAEEHAAAMPTVLPTSLPKTGTE